MQLIRAYRVRGHLEADLDPLGLDKRGPYPELDYRSYGFGEADLDHAIYLNNIFGRECASLREIIAILRQTYCGKVGVEYMHIQVPAERAWIQEKFENQPRRSTLSSADKKVILEILTTAETFERFLDRRYTGTKRNANFDFVNELYVHSTGDVYAATASLRGSGRKCRWWPGMGKSIGCRIGWCR